MKDKICKTLGNNIKKYRKLRGMTQENLAETIGLEIKSLSLIETGKNFLSAKTLANLTEVLNVSPSELFENEFDNDNQQLYSDIQKALDIIKENPAKLKALNYILNGLL